MKNKLLLSVAIFCAGVGVSFAQTQVTEVDWFNGSGTLLRDQNGNALSQGSSTMNSDGALVQLGYFSNGTAASNFAGTWIPLTGYGALPKTTIGDSPDITANAGNGAIGFSTVFTNTLNTVMVFTPEAGDTGAYITQSSITITLTTPPAGQVLAIRFYNTNAGTSGFYNTVSSDNWTWATPSDTSPTVLINLISANSAGTLEFEDAANPFKTSLLVAIPEPSSVALAGVGSIGLLLGLYRRKKTIA